MLHCKALPLAAGMSWLMTVVASSERPAVIPPGIVSPLGCSVITVHMERTKCLREVFANDILKYVVVLDSLSKDLETGIGGEKVLFKTFSTYAAIIWQGEVILLTLAPKPVKERCSLFRISSANEGGRMMTGPFLPMTWNTFPWHYNTADVRTVSFPLCLQPNLPHPYPAS